MFDYILAHVAKRKSEGFVPDMIFLTGDLANKGLVSEYVTFWLEFVAPLQETIGGSIADRTFAVPGNHDADRNEHQAFNRLEIASSAGRYLDPTEEGKKLRSMLMPRFKSYVDNDPTPTRTAFSGTDGAFSTTLEIRGSKVGIVGVNTAWLSKDENDERQLTPGKSLLENGLNATSGADLSIVLGHHPVSWFLPDQQKPIKSLLGQHRVLYLHGHLHDSWAEPSYGGGHTFLAIQAGAGFQAREGEIWRNGLVWGEAHLPLSEVRLQPSRWLPEQQVWVLASDAFHEHHRQSDWWHYPLPGAQGVLPKYSPATAQIQPPKGWSVVKSEDLDQHCAPLEKELALRFFDGAVPDWPTALSVSIPRRKIVDGLIKQFDGVEVADGPIVTLILAAGCEGKTTALLQAAHAVVSARNDWRILQRRDEAQPLVVASILPLLTKEFTWLIVIDEADRVAPEILNLVRQIPQELRGKVHCLLACRDSDWRSSGADQLQWSSVSSLRSQRLVGLDLVDATSIVLAWQAYGDVGLGNLAQLPEDRRAIALEAQAKEEAKTAGGAFFGALLALRTGTDLRNHAGVMWERLRQRKIPSGGNLANALAFIAAMHSEGLEFLSRSVLAESLGCPIEKLHREILVPLGQEAAVTTTSSYIFTRHRRIADMLTSVLEQEYGEEIGELFVRLGEAAIEARRDGQYLPEGPATWRYRFPDHFVDSGKAELAVRIAKAILAREPEDSLTRAHLASIYRKIGSPDEAVALFRDASTLGTDHRAFFFEWGISEGECDEQANSALLAAFTLSDQCPPPRTDNDHAKKALASLGLAFGKLFATYHDPLYRDARMAVATLGQSLRLDPTTAGYFHLHASESLAHGAVKPDVNPALAQLKIAISRVADGGVDPRVMARLPILSDMTFEALLRLVVNSLARKL